MVKICDFGFAAPHSQPDGTPITMNRQCGSLVYASPQSYRGDDYLGCAADIWSCAVVLYVMLCGEFPFGRPDGRHCKRYKMHERNQSVFGYLSDPADAGLVELMTGMLKINIAERSTIDQVMAHPWTKNGPVRDGAEGEGAADKMELEGNEEAGGNQQGGKPTAADGDNVYGKHGDVVKKEVAPGEAATGGQNKSGGCALM